MYDNVMFNTEMGFRIGVWLCDQRCICVNSLVWLCDGRYRSRGLCEVLREEGSWDNAVLQRKEWFGCCRREVMVERQKADKSSPCSFI